MSYTYYDSKLLKGLLATEIQVFWDTVPCRTANFTAYFEEHGAQIFRIVRLPSIWRQIAISTSSRRYIQ